MTLPFTTSDGPSSFATSMAPTVAVRMSKRRTAAVPMKTPRPKSRASAAPRRHPARHPIGRASCSRGSAAHQEPRAVRRRAPQSDPASQTSPRRHVSCRRRAQRREGSRASVPPPYFRPSPSVSAGTPHRHPGPGRVVVIVAAQAVIEVRRRQGLPLTDSPMERTHHEQLHLSPGDPLKGLWITSDSRS